MAQREHVVPTSEPLSWHEEGGALGIDNLVTLVGGDADVDVTKLKDPSTCGSFTRTRKAIWTT